MDINFNAGQSGAIRHHKGPMLVLSGPGSGKTTVIAHRIKNLIDLYGVNPSNILVITFTKAAASEMSERFEALCPQHVKGVSFGTFHSVFFRILRRFSSFGLENIITDEERFASVRRIIENAELTFEDMDDAIKSFFSDMSKMKGGLYRISEYEPEQTEKKLFTLLYGKYETYKAANEKLDFDDMLCGCHQLLSTDDKALALCRKKYHYILIDEFQDINKAQYEVIRLLAGQRRNVFAVGDDDQSIYKFRGASPEFMLNFERDFEGTKRLVLDINYRSTDEVIKISNAIIKNNLHRFSKTMNGTCRSGPPVILIKSKNPQDEAAVIAEKINKLNKDGLSLDSMAVIFRTNLQAVGLASALAKKGIPFILKDSVANIYTHWICRDICDYIRLALNSYDEKALIRIINKPSRYVSRDLINKAMTIKKPLIKAFYSHAETSSFVAKKISELEKHLDNIARRTPYEAVKYIRTVAAYNDYIISYSKYRKANTDSLMAIADEIMEAAYSISHLEEFEENIRELGENLQHSGEKTGMHGVTLSTIHSAKGLEFGAVFLAGLNEGIIPHEKSSSPDEIEEERRLLYVGVTRAIDRLFLSYSLEKRGEPLRPSQFLTELGIANEPAQPRSCK